MIVKLLTEHHLEFLCLKGGCRGSSESTLVKMTNCWKSHAAAQYGYRVSVVVFSCRDMEIAKDTSPGKSTCPKYNLLKTRLMHKALLW